MHGKTVKKKFQKNACPQYRKFALNGANLGLEVVELLLQSRVFLCHLLVLLLPLVTLLLESLDLALKVSGLDVGLSEPVGKVLLLAAGQSL